MGFKNKFKNRIPPAQSCNETRLALNVYHSYFGKTKGNDTYIQKDISGAEIRLPIVVCSDISAARRHKPANSTQTHYQQGQQHFC